MLSPPLLSVPLVMNFLLLLARLDYVFEQAQRMQLLPQGMKQVDFLQLLSVFYANQQALRSYHPSTGYNGILLLIQAAEETEENTLSADALYWGSLAPRIQRIVISATHYSLMHSPQVELVAAHLTALLDSTTARQ